MSKSAVHKQSAWAGSSGLGSSTIAASALILHLTAMAIKESSMPRQEEETKANMEASCVDTIQNWLSLQDSSTLGWPGRTAEKEKASQLGQAFEKQALVHCVESKMAQGQ